MWRRKLESYENPVKLFNFPQAKANPNGRHLPLSYSVLRMGPSTATLRDFYSLKPGQLSRSQPGQAGRQNNGIEPLLRPSPVGSLKIQDPGVRREQVIKQKGGCHADQRDVRSVALGGDNLLAPTCIVQPVAASLVLVMLLARRKKGTVATGSGVNRALER